MTARSILALVSSLDEASMFVVFAARIHHDRQQCLCSLFHAAGMCGAQALFVELQDALCADPASGFFAGARGSERINRHEALLLGALAHWQRHPGDLSSHAFELMLPPATCGAAAPLAREFARQLGRAGLRIHVDLPQVAAPAACPAPPTLTAVH